MLSEQKNFENVIITSISLRSTYLYSQQMQLKIHVCVFTYNVRVY